MHRILPLTIAGFLFSASLFSQKKPLDHSVYDSWKNIVGTTVSDDGKIIAALIAPQEGDTTLFIRDLSANRTLMLERVNRYRLSSDGKWTVGLIKAPFAERRQARIDHKKGDEIPKDSFVIIHNQTFAVEKIANVQSFKTAAQSFTHVAYSITLPKDTLKKEKPIEALILRNIATRREDTLRYAKEHLFNKQGNVFAVAIEPEKKDSSDVRGVLFFDLNREEQQQISTDKRTYRSLSFDEPGTQLVYLSTRDTSKVEQQVFDLRYFTNGADSARVIADRNASGLPEGWIFNEYASPTFSKDGRRILTGAVPKQEPKDTTLVDFEMAGLDIWHWQDPIIQPQQLAELSRERARTYTGIIDPAHPNRFTPLATEEMPYAAVSDEGNGRYALLWSDLPYLLESQWDISSKYDVWVMDLEENRLHRVGNPVNGKPLLSPMGSYLLWWDATQQHWFVYNNHDQTLRNLTEDIPVSFRDEKHDTPSSPGPYGIAAWGEKDEYLLLYDAFDIWKVDPQGKAAAVNITRHAGRSDSLTFRYVQTDPEERFIEPDHLLLLSAFDNKSKERGYYTLAQKGSQPLKKRVMEKFTYTSVTKAKEKELYLFEKSNFHTAPNLYMTSDVWKSTEKLTDINPQMNEYNWGTAELFSWTSFTGVPLQGILYKPEDFDPAKKYPVMIYFYEQHSDDLYRWFTPAPSRSVINIPFFVSRGYLVFTPDIRYTVGHPGMDAYNAVVAGAEALAKNSWADRERMAIQGQSWGGYQVAYLVTKTNMFRAAGAGAPVSNMTSAYGGIRWGSGRSRQFQYEQTQSRIGAPMNDSLQLYLDNSPLFFADKVETPLLMMHNDKDGAVPWYQSIEYFMMLRRLGKPVWLLQYNGEEHNLVQRRNSKDLSIRLQQFFDHYLKGDPAPVWMTRGVPATKKGKTWGYDTDETM
ncbi:MAG: prolyl oligopeptidase family serine peptidase [Proteiniphilum sp.]|nr:prolyl oligopeptidase family serine peptidase [Proteiniphilum sp.]